MYLILLLLWFVFNGKITVEITVLGLLLCSLLYWFMCKFMDFSLRGDIAGLKRVPSFFRYFFTLVQEIVLANLAVIRIILSPNMKIQPQLVRFKTDLKSSTNRVLLANSITLTPGTYTIRLDEDEYLVHALDISFSDGMDESVFVERLRKMEE